MESLHCAGPILGTRESAEEENMKAFTGSVFFLAALSYAQPRYHPKHVHLPETHTEQAVAMFYLSIQGPESRVDLLPTPVPYPDDRLPPMYPPLPFLAQVLSCLVLPGPSSIPKLRALGQDYPGRGPTAILTSWKAPGSAGQSHLWSEFLGQGRATPSLGSHQGSLR